MYSYIKRSYIGICINTVKCIICTNKRINTTKKQHTHARKKYKKRFSVTQNHISRPCSTETKSTLQNMIKKT